MDFTTTKIVLTTGSTGETFPITIPSSKGVIVGAFLTIADKAKLPTDIVRGNLRDSRGNDLIAAVGVTEYERRSGGSFIESMISPLKIEDKELEFRISTSTAPKDDVVMDLVLVHLPKDHSQC